MVSNTEILKFYDLDNLDKYCCSLEKFGQIENLAGDFIFLVCKECKVPLLAHQKCLSRDKTLHWNEEQCNLISSNILQSPIFQAALAKIDSRNTATFCDECNKKFANQIIFENHLQIAHSL